MAIIVPAILTKDPEEFLEKLEILEGIPEITDVHLDIEDGEFVPNHTFLPKELPKLKTRLAIEAHMMVRNPHFYYHDLEAAGINLVNLHFESFFRIADLLTAVKNLKSLGLRCGVFLNLATEVGVFDRLAGEIDVMGIMSVHPGFQGQKILPESYDRLENLRKNHPEATIEIDGGINTHNFFSIMAHRPDRIVIGSGIWHAKDARARIHEYMQKIK